MDQGILNSFQILQQSWLSYADDIADDLLMTDPLSMYSAMHKNSMSLQTISDLSEKNLSTTKNQWATKPLLKKSEALWCPTEQNSHKFKQVAHKPVARFYCESGQKKRHKHCRERRCERLLWRNNNWSSSRNQLVLTEAIKNATMNRGAGW